MAGTKTKIVSLTVKATGYAFKLAADKIINFYGVNSGADSYITYLSQMNGEVVSKTVDQTPATINTAAAKTFSVTVDDDASTTLYIHADRVVYFGELTSNTLIGYYNEQQKLDIFYVTDSASTINTACGNTFAVTMSSDGSTRYLNCNYVADFTTKTAFEQATLSVLLKAESGTVVAPGSGYNIADDITIAGGTKTTAAIVQVATSQLVSLALNAAGSGYVVNDTITLSGGTAATKAVITVLTVSAGAIATFSITTPGNYSVQATSFTQFSTSGIGTGATFNTGLFGVRTVTIDTAGNYSVTPSNPAAQNTATGSGTGATFTMAYEVLAINVVDGGNNYSNPPTITISGDGTLATATATIVNGSVNHVTVTAAGGGYTAATAAASGGTGSIIIYNDCGTAFEPYNVEETIAALQTTINAL